MMQAASPIAPKRTLMVETLNVERPSPAASAPLMPKLITLHLDDHQFLSTATTRRLSSYAPNIFEQKSIDVWGI